MEGEAFVIFKFFLKLIALGYFIALPIAGFVILINNEEAKNKDDGFWIYVLIQDITMLILTISIIITWIMNNFENVEISTIWEKICNKFLFFLNFAFSLWGIIIFFQSNEETRNYLKDEHHSLFIYLLVICCFHLIFIGIAFICLIFLACCGMIFGGNGR